MVAAAVPIEQKYPSETRDYEFDFNPLLDQHEGDAVASWTVGADVGVMLATASELDGVVRVFVAGGDNKRSYVIAADVTTTGGRVYRLQMLLRVRGDNVTGDSTAGGGGAIGIAAGSLYTEDGRLLLDDSYLVFTA